MVRCPWQPPLGSLWTSQLVTAASQLLPTSLCPLTLRDRHIAHPVPQARGQHALPAHPFPRPIESALGKPLWVSSSQLPSHRPHPFLLLHCPSCWLPCLSTEVDLLLATLHRNVQVTFLTHTSPCAFSDYNPSGRPGQQVQALQLYRKALRV